LIDDNLSANGVAQRAQGRPRAPHTDERILDAALRLMAEQGFVRMSMDTVAVQDRTGDGRARRVL
jgi:hypothetical protein